MAFLSLMQTAPWGGSEELWCVAARAALTAGHEVAVSVHDWGGLPPAVCGLEEAGALVCRRLPRPARTLRRRILWRLCRHQPTPFGSIRKYRPDIVLINQGGSFCARSYPELERLLAEWGCPFFVLGHSSDPRTELPENERLRFVELFRHAAGVGFPSEATLSDVRRQLAAPLENAFVFHNPVNLTDLSPVEWPQLETPRFAFVGRVNTLKGVPVLLEVLARPEWLGRPWILNLYGTPDNPEYIRALADFLGISKRVHLNGHQNDVRNIWRDNHLFILPSLIESAPLTLAEAMLCARPSVVSDVGGIGEWIKDNETGFLAASPSPHHLHEALECAWKARARWQEMGTAARTKCLARRDPDPAGSLLNLLTNRKLITTILSK